MTEAPAAHQSSLIIGAGSGIAQAITQQLSTSSIHQLICVGRRFEPPTTGEFQGNFHSISVDSYQPEHIDSAIEQIRKLSCPAITQVFICNGILHQQGIHPEKRLEDIDADAFMKVVSANTLTPILWLQGLLPLIQHKHVCKVIVFSARVGSISDNKLGGWYSYRSSKAALNMLLKSAAVEFARRAKNIKLISFHPGTTDTPLSKPFQHNVPQGKLFTSDFVADRLLSIIEPMPVDGELSFVDWQGETIAW